jgi:perosamine synthetase
VLRGGPEGEWGEGSGGGGAVITKNKKILRKIKYLINQAKLNENFVHNDIGYNYRLPNLNALLGISQFKKLKKFIKKKKNIHNNYINLIKDIRGVEFLPNPVYSDSNNWMNILVVDKKVFKKDIFEIKKNFTINKIETRLVWKRNSSQKMYNKYERYMINNSKRVIKNCLCMPSSTHLIKKDQYTVIKILKNESATNN